MNSQIKSELATCAFNDFIKPNWGISTTKSHKFKTSDGTPYF